MKALSLLTHIGGVIFHWHDDEAKFHPISPVATRHEVTASFPSLVSAVEMSQRRDIGRRHITLSCPAEVNLNSTHMYLAVRVQTKSIEDSPADVWWRHPCLRNQKYFCLNSLFEAVVPIDENMEKVVGHTVDMPIPRGEPGDFALGPEDPRAVLVGSELVTVFNFPTMAPDLSLVKTRLGDPGRNMYMKVGGAINTPLIKLMIRVNGTEVVLRQFEKNWSPFSVNGTLHFVRNFAPLQVIKCNLLGDCELIHGDSEDARRGNFHVGSLRGGSPLLEWRFPYFVGIAHSTTAFHTRHLYRMHVVILCMDPVELVFVSDVIEIPRSSDSSSGPAKPLMNDWFDLVEFVSSMRFEGKRRNQWILGCHVNDQLPLHLKITGLEPLVEEVMEKHQGYIHGSATLKKSCMDELALIENFVLTTVGSHTQEIIIHSSNNEFTMISIDITGSRHDFGIFRHVQADQISTLLCETYRLDTAQCQSAKTRVTMLTSMLDSGTPPGEWLSLPQPLKL